MNKKGRNCAIFLSSAFALTSVYGSALFLSSASAISVMAGSSLRYALSDNSVVDGYVNSGDLRTYGDVSGQGSSLVLGEGKAIAKMRLNNYGDAGVAYLYRASFDVYLDSLAAGGVFKICSGLPSVSSSSDNKGVLSIDIEKAYGAIFLSVHEHYGEGMETVILPKQEVASLAIGTKVRFAIDVENAGKMTLKIANKTILDGASLLESGTGYFGFMSEGDNKVLVSSMEVYGYTYNAPENVPDYLETFDQEPGAYNANYFYSASDASPVTPSYLAVDKDVGALHFSNVSAAQISTKYMYSNFEMEFSIPQLQRLPTYDENGVLTSPITTGFGIGWGIEDPMSSAGQTWANSTWLHFENIAINSTLDHSTPNKSSRVLVYSARKARHYTTLTSNFFDPNEKRIPTLKTRLVNGVLDVYIRYDDGEYGDAIFHYDLGETAEGYLRILTLGDNAIPEKGLAYASISNFSIDDWSIKNLDAEAYRQETSVDYRSNGIEGGKDFQYNTITDEGDLIGNRVGEGIKKKADVSYLDGLLIFLTTLLFGGLTFTVTAIKRR